MRKLLISIIIAVVTLTGAIPVSVAFATTGYEDSGVLSDLQTAMTDGESITLDKLNGMYSGVQLIQLTEYGYSRDAEINEHYNLYMYVYNDSGIEFGDSDSNSVQLATEYSKVGEPIAYSKLKIELVSAERYNGVQYLKYRLVDSQAVLDRVLITPDSRRYDVSGIELYVGDNNIKDYNIGGTYEYSGYAKGCDSSAMSESTLISEIRGLETVELDVRSTYYRHKNGIINSDQLTSVYFAVPDRYLTEGTMLAQVDCSWFETHTAPILVTNSSKLYDGLAPWLDVDIGIENKNVPYYLENKLYNWGYNKEQSFNGGFPGFNLTRLTYLLKTDNVEDSISSVDLMNYVYKQSTIYGSPRLEGVSGGELAASLFKPTVDAGRTYGRNSLTIYEGDKYSLDSFNAGSNFLSWWYNLSGNYADYDLQVKESILKLDAAHFLGTEKDIADRLFVLEDDVSGLYRYMQTSANDREESKTTYLMRLASTKYTAFEVKSNAERVFLDDKVVGYVATQTVFLDFDVISLTFNTDGSFWTVPAVSNPINIIPGVDAPSGIIGSGEWDWLVYLILGIAVVAIAMLLAVYAPTVIVAVVKVVIKILAVICRALWWITKYIIGAPYWLIRAIVRKVRGGIDVKE